MAANRYVPRGPGELHTIFEGHFAEFCEQYDQKWAATYGMYRLERIQLIGDRFCTCGDYLQGVVRIPTSWGVSSDIWSSSGGLHRDSIHIRPTDSSLRQVLTGS